MRGRQFSKSKQVQIVFPVIPGEHMELHFITAEHQREGEHFETYINRVCFISSFVKEGFKL